MTGDESGGSEPHVFATPDGPYMVKAQNNPQGLRVLVNELLGGLCMDWLGVEHPAPAIIDIPEQVITSSPQATFNGGTPLAHGLAFGSEYWQSDAAASVDTSLLGSRANIAATLAFDTWVPNGDSRQYRVRKARDDATTYEFVPVDQGHSFGHAWTADTLRAATPSVTVPDPVVPLRAGDLAPVISRLREFNLQHADSLVSHVPEGWWTQEERSAARDMLVARAPAAADALDAKYPRTNPPTEAEVTT